MFHRNPLRGFGAPGGRNLPIPITLAIGFYNSLHYRASRDCGRHSSLEGDNWLFAGEWVTRLNCGCHPLIQCGWLGRPAILWYRSSAVAKWRHYREASSVQVKIKLKIMWWWGLGRGHSQKLNMLSVQCYWLMMYILQSVCVSVHDWWPLQKRQPIEVQFCV